MIIWETRCKVDSFEKNYRILQQDPRFCDENEKKELIQIREKLSKKLDQRIDREYWLFKVAIAHQQELIRILSPNEIDHIAHNDLDLRYQLNELLETIIRFDIELLVDRINSDEYIPQTLLEIERLVQAANKQKISYLVLEINQINKYIQNHYYWSAWI